MDDIKFYVPGAPVPKARIPANPKTGIAYTPKKTVAYESLVRTSYASKYLGVNPTTEPIILYVSFYFPIPASAKRKKQPDKIVHGDPHMIRPDLDNLVKAILDGLNTVAFVDDKQIVGIYARKMYGITPGAYVSLRPMKGGEG
jgi:Holliday junction resolvase RusA-like endonuclease